MQYMKKNDNVPEFECVEKLDLKYMFCFDNIKGYKIIFHSQEYYYVKYNVHTSDQYCLKNKWGKNSP